HFWSKFMPKMRGLDYKGVQAAAALEAGLDEKAKSGIFKSLRAIEAFLAFSGVALGVIKMVSVKYSSNCKNYLYRYDRTPNNNQFANAESSVYFLRKNIPAFLLRFPSLPIFKIISSKKSGRPPAILDDGFLVS
ncbi:MAG: hypothetical protein LBU32_11630, partial [Clostridiales bacterium]|nr:hypothetical protein [Clostridiales bacterium]